MRCAWEEQIREEITRITEEAFKDAEANGLKNKPVIIDLKILLDPEPKFHMSGYMMRHIQ